MDEEVEKVILRIEEILSNPNDEPLDRLGSYIVGATLVREDIEPIFEACPPLEKIAELGADLETQGGTEYASKIFDEIERLFDELKKGRGTGGNSAGASRP